VQKNWQLIDRLMTLSAKVLAADRSPDEHRWHTNWPPCTKTVKKYKHLILALRTLRKLKARVLRVDFHAILSSAQDSGTATYAFKII
jgi:hypothetical protein